MKPITFALMLVAQRVDDVLRIERHKLRPDFRALMALRKRKKRVSLRLRRSLGLSALAGS